MVWLIIIVAIIIILGIIGSAADQPKQQDSSANKIIDVDVPNPLIHPEKFLDFIEKTKADYLWQIEQQLNYTNNLCNIILQKALSEKSLKGTFNKEYYLKLLQKAKPDSMSSDELHSAVDDKFYCVLSFKIAGAFLEYRKEKLIFDVEEGSIVTLKREPHNKFDSNAIAITQGENFLGYVPRTDTEEISDIMKFEHVAKIADIIYDEDYIDVIINMYQSDEANPNPQYFLDNRTILELRARKIDSKFLRPKKNAEDTNMFYNKKVVITGEFENFVDRNDLAKILYESGADIDCTISERTHYIIAGENPGWRKMERARDLGIMIFDEAEIKKILSI